MVAGPGTVKVNDSEDPVPSTSPSHKIDSLPERLGRTRRIRKRRSAAGKSCVQEIVALWPTTIGAMGVVTLNERCTIVNGASLTSAASGLPAGVTRTKARVVEVRGSGRPSKKVSSNTLGWSPRRRELHVAPASVLRSTS